METTNKIFSEDEELSNEELEKLTDRQIMMMNLRNSFKIKKDLKKLKRETIPKIHKNIETLKTDQLMQRERIEILEDNSKSNNKEIEANKTEIKRVEDPLEQLNHEQRKQQNDERTVTDEIENKIDRNSTPIRELQEKVLRLEEDTKKVNYPER